MLQDVSGFDSKNYLCHAILRNMYKYAYFSVISVTLFIIINRAYKKSNILQTNECSLVSSCLKHGTDGLQWNGLDWQE